MNTNENYTSEEERLSTFKNWYGNIDEKKLAKAGFVYTQISNVTICNDCGLVVNDWSRDDNPIDIHLLKSRDCPFIKQYFGEDITGVGKGNFMKKEVTRLASFKNWPMQLKQSPKKLAKAGFYYSGENDKVICHACHIELFNWEKNDDEWEEHIYWSPRCPYVLSHKSLNDESKEGEEEILYFHKENPNARTPRRSTPQSAGYDIAACEDGTIPPHSHRIFTTGLRVEIPQGYYGRIAGKSSLSAKYGICVGAGVIDADYRGVMNLDLYNHSSKPFTFESGDYIAQLICERICYPRLKERVINGSETIRGEKGGINKY